jgi:hypothetical protein
MRSRTAVRRHLRVAARDQSDRAGTFLQVKTDVVGLAGLEPAASSLSGIEGSALCAPASSQVTGDRRGRRDAF